MSLLATRSADSPRLESDPALQVAATLEQLRAIARDFPRAALASSLSAEDMVLTDLICRNAIDIELFTLDTGRLHRDTLDLLTAIEARYARGIQVFRPREQAVADYVAANGRDGFYTSVEARKSCCAIRKVEPLARALEGRGAWITGLRREQSVTRAALPAREYDATNGLAKFNPLADWDAQAVWTYIREHAVPYNRLHDQGYPSIGCAPCTRPITPSEDVRAGRWWWEAPQSRECGLHVGPDGSLTRLKKAPV